MTDIMKRETKPRPIGHTVASPRLWIAISLVLGLISAVYITRGFLIYSRGPAHGPGQNDVLWRWLETRYVLRGQNPYDVMFAHSWNAAAVAPPAQHECKRDSRIAPELGVPVGLVYPPWAYFSTAAICWVPRAVMVPLYAVLMVASLLFIAHWGYRTGRPWGDEIAMAVVALCLSLASWVGAIFLGNFPTLLMALLIGCLLLLERNRSVGAGLLLAIALLKPTFAGPLVLVFLVRKQLVALSVVAVYNLVATWVVCARVHTPPLEMFGQMLASSQLVVGFGTGPVQYLINAGVAPALATNVVGTCFLGVGAAAIFLARRASLLSLFGIAAVIARLWAYHLYYDDSILLFLLIALVHRALQTRSRSFAVCAVLCAISLISPGRATEYLGFQVFQQVAWCASAFLLVLDARGRTIAHANADAAAGVTRRCAVAGE